MIPQVDFDIADSILKRSSEIRVYIGNTCHIKKSKNIQDFILVPGVQKNNFFDFPDFFTKNPEILESRVRRPGNLE